MAARSAKVTFHNQADVTLTLDQTSLSLPHGAWISNPPNSIPPGNQGQWETDSDKFAEGTEGRCNYQFNNQTVELFWVVPYVGENQFDINVSTSDYQGSHDHTNDSNASVNFYLKKN
jgi:hypothetical protein